MNLIQELVKKELITPPKWLPNNVQYLVMVGSVSYGASNDSSDIDVCGYCMPPINNVFPHLAGHIQGFGNPDERFEQWTKHHILDIYREYDMSVYSIVKYFNLMMVNNPNMVDSLFVPSHCILYQSQIAQKVREKRKMFLHKGSWSSFKGCAYSNLRKMKNKGAKGNRKELIEKYGYDVDYAYHLVRLLLEVEEILNTGDLTLNKNGEMLKEIRQGAWSENKVVKFFHDKKMVLETAYTKSSLPEKPNEGMIKDLLVDCLEFHYGTISDRGQYRQMNGIEEFADEMLALISKYTARSKHDVG